jgi:hypothetical protein
VCLLNSNTIKRIANQRVYSSILVQRILQHYILVYKYKDRDDVARLYFSNRSRDVAVLLKNSPYKVRFQLFLLLSFGFQNNNPCFCSYVFLFGETCF